MESPSKRKRAETSRRRGRRPLPRHPRTRRRWHDHRLPRARSQALARRCHRGPAPRPRRGRRPAVLHVAVRARENAAQSIRARAAVADGRMVYVRPIGGRRIIVERNSTAEAKAKLAGQCVRERMLCNRCDRVSCSDSAPHSPSGWRQRSPGNGKRAKSRSVVINSAPDSIASAA